MVKNEKLGDSILREANDGGGFLHPLIPKGEG